MLRVVWRSSLTLSPAEGRLRLPAGLTSAPPQPLLGGGPFGAAEWWRGSSCAKNPSTIPDQVRDGPPHEIVGRKRTASSPAPPDPVRAVFGERAMWGGRGFAAADRCFAAVAVGPGPHGDPRIGAHPPARAPLAEPGPRRGARRARCAVGDGGGGKMRRAVGRDRRIVGRPARARLHRDAAAGGRRRAQRSRGFPDPARRACQSERGRGCAGGSRARPASPIRSTRARRARRHGTPSCSARTGFPARTVDGQR